MNELNNFIKEINLVFTNTIDRYEFCKKDFNLNNYQVNYTNSISIYNLVNSFNKLYTSFKKEYEKLDKLSLGNYIEILNYNKFNLDKDNYRTLRIYIEEPIICNTYDTTLYICEKNNNEIYSFTINERNYPDERTEIKLDKEKCKKYLDLFDKYKLLLDTYKILNNGFIFGDGTNSLFTIINGELLEKIENFEIAFGQNSINTANFIKLFINLNQTINIDINSCNIILDDKKIIPNNQICTKLFKEVYINKLYLKRK